MKFVFKIPPAPAPSDVPQAPLEKSLPSTPSRAPAGWLCVLVCAAGLFGAGVGAGITPARAAEPDVNPAAAPVAPVAVPPAIAPAAPAPAAAPAAPAADGSVIPPVAPAPAVPPASPGGLPSRVPPAPGMPGWARPGAPALGPVIELEPEPDDPAPSVVNPPRGAARNPTMTLIDRVRGITSKSTLGGYGEFVFHKYPGQDSAFEARRFVLFLFSPITDHISIATEFEWEKGGTPTKQQGQLGIGEALIEFAVVDVKIVEPLTLRAGIILMPLGRLNVNHDSPSLEFTDRPLVNLYIIPSTWWEMGAGITGRVNAGVMLFSYEAYVVNGLDSNIADGAGLRGARGSVTEDNNNDKALTGRLAAYFFNPRKKHIPTVEIGLSGYSGEYDRSQHRVNMVAGDLLVRHPYVELAGEYVRAFIDPGFDDDYATSSRRVVPTAMQGFYVELRGRIPLRLFVPKLRMLPLWLGEASILIGLRYEEIDTDLSVHNLNDRKRLSVGANLRLSAAFVWKHEIQWTVDDAVGRRREINEDPALGYVTSVAFLF